MKLLIAVFAFMLGSWSYAGGFLFPNVEYSYAKLYLFNIELDKPSNMDFNVYKEGVYGHSKIGNGQVLSDEFHKNLQDVLKRGIDELIMGLSKCYMPRHGIIYYDVDHNPVASLSVCFECDKISVWSKAPYHFSNNYEHFDYDKAEKQITDLQEVFRKEGISVYNHFDDLDKYEAEIAQDKMLRDSGTIFIEMESKEGLKFFESPLTQDRIKSWLHSFSGSKFSVKTDSLYSSFSPAKGVTSLHYDKGTHFVFNSTEANAKLLKAIILSPEILLPDGISVGMSLEEVMRKMDIMKGERHVPARIVVHGPGFRMDYIFKRSTVNQIIVEIG